MLEHLREKLEHHFETLVTARDTSAYRIFALEHCLSEEEVNALQSELNSKAYLQNDNDFWLLWVINAAEVGYHYDGHEYWQSFQEKNYNWHSHNRWRIAHWFQKFCDTYDGVVPTGQWANHFKYISWPITHAVLPKHSQRQFAYALYKSMFAIKSRNAPEIGQLLASNSYDAPTRFQEFLQQKELAGRITLALLFEDEMGGEIIYKPTLERLIDGLEETRASKEFLKRARVIARDRIEGIARGSFSQGSPLEIEKRIRTNRDGNEPDEKISIMPAITLQYADTGWAVYLNIPSFQELSALDEKIGKILQSSRCIINGINSRRPAGWLLSGSNKVKIEEWFEDEKPLIQLEEENSILGNMLNMSCALPPETVRLFKIMGGETSREINSKIVRSCQEYILLSTEELYECPTWVKNCKIDCHNIHGLMLCIPVCTSDEDEKWLRSLGLQSQGIVEVWPAGLSPRGWDGEGNSEWLTSENPCFGISHDYPVKEYLLTLNNSEHKKIEMQGREQPIFIELEKLVPGQHILSVKAIRQESNNENSHKMDAEGHAKLNVREPQPWKPGVISHSGLLVRNEPLRPKFVDFWKDEIDIWVYGPENHDVKIFLEFKKSDGKPMRKYISENIPLPVVPKQWKEEVDAFYSSLLKKGEMLEHYFSSDVCLVIDGGELGKNIINLDRTISALRWFVTFLENKREVILFDDTGLEEEIKAIEFGMKNPLKPLTLHNDDFSLGYNVSPPGGSLFKADKGSHKDIVVVSSNNTNEFGVVPNYGKDFEKDIFKMLDIWSKASVFDLPSSIKQRKMIEHLISQIYKILCGPAWIECEKNNSENLLEELKFKIRGKSGFRATLVATGAEMMQYDSNELTGDTLTIAYSRIVEEYLSIDDAMKKCRLALQISSHPHKMNHLKRADIEEIKKVPAVMQGARFLALASAINNESIKYGNLLLPRWKW